MSLQTAVIIPALNEGGFCGSLGKLALTIPNLHSFFQGRRGPHSGIVLISNFGLAA